MRLTLNCLQLCICIFSLFMIMGTECALRRDTRPVAAYTAVIHVSPLQKTYQTGDTIWFSYSNPDHVFARQDNGQLLVLDTFSIPVSMTIYGGFGQPQDSSGDYCEFLTGFGTDAGVVTGNFSRGVFLTYGCQTGGRYDFKIGVRLKKTGVFVLVPGGGLFVNCPERVLKINQANLDFTLDAGDGNYDIYQAVPEHLQTTAFSIGDLIAKGGALAIRVE